jgi:hypothetical protein
VRAVKDLGSLLLRGNVLVEKLGMSIEIANQDCDPRRFHSWDGACTLRLMLMSHSGTPNALIWNRPIGSSSSTAGTAPLALCRAVRSVNL